MKKLIILLLLIFGAQLSYAHIGSSAVQMQGQAGPYSILVSIQPPDVIPGTAKVSVFVQDENIFSVHARPLYFRSGDKGAPSPDILQKSKTNAGQFEADIWLMEPGSTSAQILVKGDKGSGELVVPIMAVSTAQRDMPNGLGIALSILAIILFTLMITIIGASVGEAMMPPGSTASNSLSRKKYWGMGIAAIVCSLILFGGRSWWNSWAADYKQYLYKPLKAETSILKDSTHRIFQLKIDTKDWAEQRRGSMLSTLVPDHGKLMHTFLVKIPGLDAFAHIHPERQDSITFTASLPKLPAGKYVMYSDIIRYSGFAETITDTIVIPEPGPVTHESVEDTYVITDPIFAPGQVTMDEDVVICGKPGTKTLFPDGSFAVWEGKPDQALEVGKPYKLNFEIYNPDGTPCLPEPYLGMMGHAMLMKTDGSVYIHLHPGGSFPAAAEKIFKSRLSDTTKIIQKPSPKIFKDSVDHYLARLKNMSVLEREEFLMTEMGMYDLKENGMVGMDHGSLITFPYSFPKAGRYRIFLQIKRNERVMTGVFDVMVKDPLNI